jgi:hypothetical protein
MGKRIVTVEVTRYYSKTAMVEVAVDDELVDDALVDFLTNDEDLDNEFENALFDASLVGEDTTYEYSDITNNIGGHL